MDAIRDRILARCAAGDLAMINARVAKHLDDMTMLLNEEGVTAVLPRWVNGRTVLAECANGDDIIRKIHAAMAADPVIELAWAYLLNAQGLDLGEQSTRDRVDTTVVAGVWTADEGAQLKALAMQPVLVDRLQVELAMYGSDGKGIEVTA